MRVSNEKLCEDRELSGLEKLGLVQMELMDIEKQLTALYSRKKGKQAEANEIWEQILIATRKGKTIYDKEGERE